MQGYIPRPEEQSVFRAIELQTKGRLTDAARLLTQSLLRGALTFESAYSLGAIAANEGSIHIAIAMFEAALKFRPSSKECIEAIRLLERRRQALHPDHSPIAPTRQEPSDNTLKSSSDDLNHYCTYFDSNYAPRGLAMIDSLLKNDPHAIIYVLCLDATTESVLKDRHPSLLAITLDELCTADPELSACRSNRSAIEWYFTATSCLCHYLITQSTQNLSAITYLDADLFFYHSPKVLHEECEDACAHVIEHRFTPHLESLIRYGRFNVGWIKFNNNDTGRRLLADYRSDCIDWCYDKLEGVLFADQKYLDFWPDLYPDLCISKHLGANVAAWNVGSYQLSYDGAKLPYVNGVPLLFYHFHGIGRDPDGGYFVKGKPELGVELKSLYAEYINVLNCYEIELRRAHEINYKELRYAAN